MSSFRFFALKFGKQLAALPEAPFSRLGVMYCSKLVAEHLKAHHGLEAADVLFRADAHEMTYNTSGTGLKKDVLHWTFDVKTKEMQAKGVHLTVHANIRLDPTGNPVVKNMFDIGSTIPKYKKGSTTELAILNDSYHDPKKGKKVNNWDPAGLQEYPVPPELNDFQLGEGFTTILNNKLEGKSKDEQKAERDAALAAYQKSIALVIREPRPTALAVIEPKPTALAVTEPKPTALVVVQSKDA